MRSLVFLAVIITRTSCIVGSPMFDLTEARALQTRIDQGTPINHLFEDFKRIFGRRYEDTKEENIRRAIFQENVKYIGKHNMLYANGNVSFHLAVNQFTDLTNKEFRSFYTGHLLKRPTSTNASTFLPPSNVNVPTTVDWRQHGYVTPIKNQGACGSCWAFSATGSLEGQHFKKTGNLVSLSEQQLVDCSKDFANEGCQGGLMDQAFDYIKAVGGLEKESDYPYKAQDMTCTFEKSKAVATVTGYVDIKSESESALHTAVGTVGPVSVAIDASQGSFQFYSGGVYYEPSCSSLELDHGVLAVGYGSDGGEDYWLVKNSWGTSWGLQGYIKMSRNRENNCGIATDASYPLV